MSAIGKGDWVLCLRDDVEVGGGSSVYAGHTYYCEGLISGVSTKACDWCGDDGDGLVLSGVTRPNEGWCHCNFKPLGGGLKAPTEARELADA